VFVVILFLFYLPTSYNFSFLIDIHTHFIYTSVINILDFFAFPFIFQERSIMLPNHFTIDIVDDCNAFLPFLLFAAAIFASSEKVTKKLFWVLLGWFTIMLSNIIRILLLVFITNQNKNLFFISHDISTYFFMPLILLTLYWFFLKKNQISV